MLFDKKIDPSCSYCEFGAKISDTEVMCIKKGVVSAGSRCGKFSYDPLRREPPKPVVLDTSSLSEKDFEL